IILVGAPWYLKGVDVLIAAFLELADDFPDLRLKLLGHYPDADAFRKLTHGSDRVEILRAVRYPEALEMIAGASVLALPSRCEGMGRVLIEAMAAGVPVVGSDVGGIPYMIREGENGFVVPVEDARKLSARLRELLSNEDLRRRLGEQGREMALSLWSEQVYVDEFTRMVRASTECGRNSDQAARDARGVTPAPPAARRF
ncbi:MAG: glycosyltransferase family 4 protein, partial [Acidobacteriota bacterium]|nr:glycosyltransferase family 4 protein [Acidobacteriota bacterium]